MNDINQEMANATQLLRNKYSPEGSLLRKDQMHLLDMVFILDEICKKHGIEWWLSSGTLLGAARHQGFIPWDDDMDIVMLKKDYKKLLKILAKENLQKYVMHSLESDFNYINIFGKFREREGVAKTGGWYDYYAYKGIGFDIFSIERVPYWGARLADSIYNRILGRAIRIKNNRTRKVYIRTFQALLFNVFFPIIRVIGYLTFCKEYHYTLGTGWPKHTFYMKDTFPLTTLSFEGFELPAPHNPDNYLTRVYGDWRKLPTDEQIKNAIHCQAYRDEIFGKDK